MVVTRDLAGLSIKTEATATPPEAVTYDATHMSRGALLCAALKGLPHVRSSFLSSFDDKKEALAKSR